MPVNEPIKQKFLLELKKMWDAPRFEYFLYALEREGLVKINAGGNIESLHPLIENMLRRKGVVGAYGLFENIKNVVGSQISPKHITPHSDEYFAYIALMAARTLKYYVLHWHETGETNIYRARDEAKEDLKIKGLFLPKERRNRVLQEVHSVVESVKGKTLEKYKIVYERAKQIAEAERKRPSVPTQAQVTTTPALAKAVEEMEVPAGLPALAHKLRNMLYNVGQMFHHPEDPNVVSMEGIKTIHALMGKRRALLQLIAQAVQRWEEDLKAGKPLTPLKNILLEELKRRMEEDEILRNYVSQISSLKDVNRLLEDENIRGRLLEVYETLGIGKHFTQKELARLHEIIESLHEMDTDELWKKLDRELELAERAAILKSWEEHLKGLGIQPKNGDPNTALPAIRREIKEAMERRLSEVLASEVAQKNKEIYRKLEAEAKKIMENIEDLHALAEKLHELRKIDPYHGSELANHLYTAALDGALRGIATQGAAVMQTARFSKDAAGMMAASLLKAVEKLGIKGEYTIPPMLAGVEYARRNIKNLEALRDFGMKVSALDTMVGVTHDSIGALLEKPELGKFIEGKPYIPAEHVTETLERLRRTFQAVVPRERPPRPKE